MRMKLECLNFKNGKIKIISGKHLGISGPGKPHTGMLYFDILLDIGSDLILPIENGLNYQVCLRNILMMI